MKILTISCVCCGKWLNSLTNGELDASQDMLKDGATAVVDVGYGSKFDQKSLIIGVCDDCLKQKLDDGVILEADKRFCATCGHEV